MSPPKPADTKLVISSYHRFTLWRSPPEMAEAVRKMWPEMRVLDLPHYDRITPELSDTDIFVGLLLRPEQLRQAPKLKWVHTTSAGVGQLMYPEFRASGITLTNASGVHAPAMAEHIAGMLVAMARDFPGSMRFQAQRKWGQQEIWDGRSRPRELSGAVALLVGFGAVGRAAAERLRAMHMISDLTARDFGGYHAVLAVHAEGSIEAEKLQIYRAYEPGRAIAYAKRLAGLE